MSDLKFVSWNWSRRIFNLAQQPNHMTREVAELLENRTTLLAGISMAREPRCLSSILSTGEFS